MARTITRWEPFAELADMRSRFDRMLGELGDGGRDWVPAIDVVRSDGELVVRAEVPGVKPEEIEVKADQGLLTISGKHEESSESKEENFVRRERRFGSFARTLARGTIRTVDAVQCVIAGGFDGTTTTPSAG